MWGVGGQVSYTFLLRITCKEGGGGHVFNFFLIGFLFYQDLHTVLALRLPVFVHLDICGLKSVRNQL